MSSLKGLDLSHFAKLDGSNYTEWKLRVTLLLKSADTWNVVTGTTTKPVLKADGSNSDAVKAWEKLDTKAQTIMVALLVKRQLSRLKPDDG